MKTNDISRKYFPAYSIFFYVLALFDGENQKEIVSKEKEIVQKGEEDIFGLLISLDEREVFVGELGFDWFVVFEPSKKNKQEEIYNQDDFLNVCLDIHKFLNRK